ncbi:MAG: NAD(P)/FAD-dependent oxidoreductase [Anaerovoracaceae bacterium]
MIHEKIIIGGGAAGLFCAASSQGNNSVILEGNTRPGRKLLMSGGGHCNLTHGGNIKDFISHYGDKGKMIRSVLYRHNNLLLVNFFKEHGLPLIERDDGKVFPTCLSAEDVLDLLLSLTRKNGYTMATNVKVKSLEPLENGNFKINDKYECKQVVVATGGCSYPSTGSDGSMFSVLEKLGLNIIAPHPALTTISAEGYPYQDLSGMSFSKVEITLEKGITIRDDLLFTHTYFSGPAVLTSARYLSPGQEIKINYCPDYTPSLRREGNNKQVVTYFTEAFGLPKRFIETIAKRSNVDGGKKISSLTKKEMDKIAALLTGDKFCVSSLGGFNKAMVTAGGVSLDEINLKTFESKKYPGLYIIGEALDVDGDTGGYNLQWAFSSGYKCV